MGIALSIYSFLLSSVYLTLCFIFLCILFLLLLCFVLFSFWYAFSPFARFSYIFIFNFRNKILKKFFARKFPLVPFLAVLFNFYFCVFYVCFSFLILLFCMCFLLLLFLFFCLIFFNFFFSDIFKKQIFSFGSSWSPYSSCPFVLPKNTVIFIY